MKCEKARELFSDHLEMALERPLAAALERHLAECPACEHDYASFQTTWQMLESLPEVEPPPGFATDVVTKLRLEREAERRARSRWQVVWGDMFASRLPVRVFAAAVAFFLCVMIVLHTPLRGIVGAWLLPSAKVISTDASTPMPGAWRPGDRAMEWLNSGLDFELAPSSAGSRSIFKLLLKPKKVSSLRVRVSVMPPGAPRFDRQGVSEAGVVSDSVVRDTGQVIPFILGQSGDRQEVVTALIQWQHRNTRFAEAVFVPTRVNTASGGTTGSVYIQDMELYAALQEVSAAFGAVILVNADINAKVADLAVENVSADDALYKLCRSVGLRYRPLIGAQVYVVDRKVQ